MSSRRAEPRSETSYQHVLVIAERGVDLTAHLADLDRKGCRIEQLTPIAGESSADFRARIGTELGAREAPHDLTLFVAGEPIGARLHELVRTIVCSMLPGARLVLAPERPGPFAARALSALALTVMEQARGTDISVESGAVASVPEKAWRRRIDRALHGLLKPIAADLANEPIANV